MIHTICEKRGWRINDFLIMPLGEQESYIAFEIVNKYIKLIENLKEIRSIEKNKRADKKTEQDKHKPAFSGHPSKKRTR